MPAIKELTDILSFIQELSEDRQRDAVKSLLPVLERAERDFSEAHLTDRERRHLRREAHLNWMEKRYGKAFTDRTRAYVAHVERFGVPPDWDLNDKPDAGDERPKK